MLLVLYVSVCLSGCFGVPIACPVKQASGSLMLCRLVMTHPHKCVFIALDLVDIRPLFYLKTVFSHFLLAVLSGQNLACIAQSVWQMWRPSASLMEIFPMPYLKMASKDVLTAIRWTKSREPRPTADRTIGERCIAGREHKSVTGAVMWVVR